MEIPQTKFGVALKLDEDKTSNTILIYEVALIKVQEQPSHRESVSTISGFFLLNTKRLKERFFNLQIALAMLRTLLDSEAWMAIAKIIRLRYELERFTLDLV